MMKNLALLILFLLTASWSFSQDFDKLASYEFKTVESYETEKPVVLRCANYLFEHPANREELNRLRSVQYILKWMQGTPEYTFEINDEALELTRGNQDLLGLYMAALSKVAIEQGNPQISSSDLHDQAADLLVRYCADPLNEMKPSRKIKKILKSS